MLILFVLKIGCFLKKNAISFFWFCCKSWPEHVFDISNNFPHLSPSPPLLHFHAPLVCCTAVAVMLFYSSVARQCCGLSKPGFQLVGELIHPRSLVTLVTVAELIWRGVKGCYRGQWCKDFCERQEEAGKTRLDQLESADCSMLWTVSLAEERGREGEAVPSELNV